jgi:hypothetical protein
LNSNPHHSPLSSHLRDSFTRFPFSIYVHVYTLFASYSPFLSLPPPLSHCYQPLLPNRQDLFFPPVLWLFKWKEKNLR